MAGFDEDRLADAYERALAAEKQGRHEEAAAAYRECLQIDPDDHAGAAVRIASMGIGDPPPSAGEAYVSTLFDQHADDFEDILVRQLAYGIPELIAARLSSFGRFSRVLDLGCGTGLVGEAIRDTVDVLIGVDLSEGMIETCFDKDLYDHLYIGEAAGFLEDFDEPDPFDLIVAADVLPYVGDVDPLFSAAAARLGADGLFVFSTETLAEAQFGGRPYVVGRHQRFHHREDHLRDRLHAIGLHCLEASPVTVRMQEGEPAPGHLFLARKPASA